MGLLGSDSILVIPIANINLAIGKSGDAEPESVQRGRPALPGGGYRDRQDSAVGPAMSNPGGAMIDNTYYHPIECASLG